MRRMRKFFLSLILIIIFDSGSYGSWSLNYVNDKDFWAKFDNLIIEIKRDITEWWNFKRDTRQNLKDINKKLDNITELLNLKLDKGDENLSIKKNELKELELKLNELKNNLDERERNLNIEENKLIDRENNLDSREKIIKLNESLSLKASEIYNKLISYENIKKFINSNSLVIIDSVKFFLLNSDRDEITPFGKLAINVNDQNGIVNQEELKNNLKELLNLNKLPFGRGNNSMEFNLRNEINNIELDYKKIFFSLDNLNYKFETEIDINNYAKSVIENILKSDNKSHIFRIFFRTPFKGLYVTAVYDSDKDTAPAMYLAAGEGNKLIAKKNLNKEIKKMTEIINNESIIFSLRNKKFADIYLEIFVKNLIENIPDYKN